MPTYRFSWNAFDDETVHALADLVGYNPHSHRLDRRTWLANTVKRPNKELVSSAKQILVETWLARYEGTAAIVRRLVDRGIGPENRVPASPGDCVAFLRRCRNSNTLQELLLSAMLHFGDMDGISADPSDGSVSRFAILTPSKQTPDDRVPHHYQEGVWNQLSGHLAEAQVTGEFKGLLVMPTGSGKTFTAVRWLMEKHVNRGGRVLWIAHRHELLEQATQAFYTAAYLVRNRNQLRIRIVSGAHCAVTQIDPGDHILLCSVSSLARRMDVAREVLADPDLFMVVDEAHHAPAKSYRTLIEGLSSLRSQDHPSDARPVRLLGLTATPTRMIDTERPILSKLFGDRVIAQIQLRDLIEQGFLARPMPVHVKTKANVESGVTQRDLSHLNRFNELSEIWLDRIANMEARNQVIVDHFVANRERYGKTLIFAINIVHAILLTEALRQRGIRTDCVASYGPHRDPRENKTIIEQFRESEGGIDVLVNVQILTEGVDVPAIQTVLLTRPTASETLMRQMVGRALRGPKAGGTEKAYLVSFEDHWERFHNWESPLTLVRDIVGEVTPPEPGQGDTLKRLIQADAIPWDLIQAVAVEFRNRMGLSSTEAFEAIPHGWYVLQREVNSKAVRQVIPVYEHQRPSWDALLDRLRNLDAMDRARLGRTQVGVAVEEFFYDCDIPIPGEHQVGEMLAHFRDGGDVPDFYRFETRKLCDPLEVAIEIKERNLNESEKAGLIEQRFSIPFSQAVHPTLREYTRAIEDALYGLRHPKEATRVPRGIPVFESLPAYSLTAGPAHDLEKLMKQVLATGAEIITLPHLPFRGELEWSRRPIKGWYGIAHWEPENHPGTGRIRINVLLNSPDVDRSTIEFLLWHEYLHLYLQQLHTPKFRDLERRWPSYIKAECELNNLNERFGFQYW